jgi:hypothetical protein
MPSQSLWPQIQRLERHLQSQIKGILPFERFIQITIPINVTELLEAPAQEQRVPTSSDSRDEPEQWSVSQILEAIEELHHTTKYHGRLKELLNIHDGQHLRVLPLMQEMPTIGYEQMVKYIYMILILR